MDFTDDDRRASAALFALASPHVAPMFDTNANDARLREGVAAIHETLDTHRCKDIPDSGGVCAECGTTWSQIYSVPNMGRSTYKRTPSAAERFAALRAMGSE